MKLTVVDQEPTCGAGVLMQDDTGHRTTLRCVLPYEHAGPDHEDDEGNRWHSTFARTAPFPAGEVVESVVWRWAGQS